MIEIKNENEIEPTQCVRCGRLEIQFKIKATNELLCFYCGATLIQKIRGKEGEPIFL